MTPAPTKPVIKRGGFTTYANPELQAELLKMRRGDVAVQDFLDLLGLVVESHIAHQRILDKMVTK